MMAETTAGMMVPMTAVMTVATMVCLMAAMMVV